MPGSTRDKPLARRVSSRGPGVGVLMIGLLVWLTSPVRADEPLVRGEAIYQQLCLDCHGGGGLELLDSHGDPLHGDRTLDELKAVIADTMPDGFPEDCVGEDAEAVAAYLYEAIYSPEAKQRNEPPRIELQRLTVRQYETSVADLLASFTGRGQPGDQPGLQGTYYKTRNTRREDQVFERVDPSINFQFGQGTPDDEKIENPEEFSIRWDGCLIAPETGEYELMVKTENGFRLWVNDNETALIDAWVASGGEVMEHRATIKLLGGRAYPIRLQTFKWQDKSFSMTLNWRPPNGTWEVIPQRSLAANQLPATMVVTAPFPPDDGSAGYERGTSVSKEWDAATTAAAIEVAGAVARRIDRLAGVRGVEGEGRRFGRPSVELSPEERDDRLAKIQEFCAKFAERAFRRPLSDDLRRFFVDSRFEQAEDVDTAVKQSVILVLKSPRFLFPGVGSDGVDDYDIASRLALALWDSIPDDGLIQAAAAGTLRDADEVERQARRMLDDPRARAKVQAFFHTWLPFEKASTAAKDPEVFPGFDEALLADLKTSLELFLDEVVWSEASDYRQLLLGPELYLNDRLANFYGVEVPQDGNFHKVTLDDGQRAGIVTHPFLLSALSYHANTSPIHRGVFATRKLLARALKPPPEAIEFNDSRFDPHLTMREKVAEITQPANCMGCHTIINPLGFSLESFDAVGRFRLEDSEGRPIDASAEFPTVDGRTVPLSGARDLARLAAESEEARRGFVGQLFQYLAKQPAEAYGRKVPDTLTESFQKSDFQIRALMVKIARTVALKGVAPQESTQVARN